MSGTLEKKGKVKWSPRFVSLIEIQSSRSSISNFKIVQLLVYKNQKDIFPVNSIEIR